MSVKSASPTGRPAFRMPKCRTKYARRAACRSWSASLQLDIRGLNDRPPAIRLGFLVGAKCLRCLQVKRGDLDAELVEALPSLRIEHDLCHRRVELGGDCPGRALRHPQP